MEKRMIQLDVPAIGKTYDIWVPKQVPVSEVSRTLALGVKEMSDGMYFPSGREMIIDLKAQRLLNPACTLEDYNIGDGDELLLV